MMKIQIILILVSSLLITVINTRSVAQDNFEIRKITFNGNKTLEKNFLTDNMVLKELSWAEKVLTKKEPSLYNEELMQADLVRLKQVYQREGFLFAGVSLKPLTIDNEKQTVKVTVIIDEGEPVLTDSVIIATESPEQISDTLQIEKEIRKKLILIKGERFRDDAIKEDIRIIEEAFNNMGFAYARVSFELKLDPEKYKTDIYYSVNTGNKSRIGETTISGNENVSEKLIRKQIKYDEGMLYNKSALNETRQNLYDLQLFRIVSVSPGKDYKTEREQIPVSIYVEEAPRLTTRAGTGYGTEDKFRAFIDVNLRGFPGESQRLNFRLKHSGLEPYSVHLQWIQPHFPGIKSSISLNPFLESKSEPGYKLRTYGINIPFTYKFNKWFNSKLTYYFEDVNQAVEAGDRELPGLENDNFLYNKSGILLSAVFDNSIPEFSPVKGINLSFGLKVNGYIFGSDFSYTRLWGDFRTYRKISDLVLAYRIMAGGTVSSDKDEFIPVGDRFYSGGSNSIRGWNRAGLGPRRETGSPLGGKSIFESNFEVRYNLFWRLNLVAFIEAGNVRIPSFSYDLSDLGYAAGTGIRIDTPVGPVRLDAGFPVWNTKKSPQFFISVGQAF
jgi:outer membrane protein insertion porin family